MPAVSDAVWSAKDTTPDAIAGALRELLAERHAENGGFVPARALNMIAFVDREWSGEIANRLRGVGRYHASRLIVLAYEQRRARIDARATVASEGDPRPGELSLLRETVVVELGERHLDDLLTIADPLVVSDLPTLLWSPHGHHEVVEQLLALAQAVLLDSVDEPDPREAIARARALARRAYVVDLAWLRSTPWRERIATAFDPPGMRPELYALRSLAIRHHPDSTVAAMLLAGWLATRLGWEVGPLRAADGSAADAAGRLEGVAHRPPTRAADASELATERSAARSPTGADAAHSPAWDVALALEPARELQVRGLAGIELGMAAGGSLRLDRGAGGLRAHSRNARGGERAWTILGASRGETGILGEGIRQALLRDPTYAPALAAAAELAAGMELAAEAGA